ncbi:MAG: BlaI/MecI/CopY family transcriptional regulator [Runella slithyformis]|jgi:BlaI family transcriptional regulator, penicillinase repressor|nr:MAG: BlaI/MecI/CopY family transcriptional regulator [Runella slithyformis]TAF97715.1 MAG: BlaI/MecI/CopY family transcriptional regulator [Runella sp.]TAG22711.1 MAG: BlaI/MecI/CopY family transcriptional regulator [Cytophagales bacterium]TAG41821.1 MAG: BlaI/MecI/CopY family transcriptional regulator [Cytophagia bacterium]TAF81516.1 MAG: BlaI/MecI/CopY family transcriptional regulator [Runella slithyformis]
MRELTKAEEEIMQILWDVERAVVWDIIERMPEPYPAYNTVSTFIRILEQKGFVNHDVQGKTHTYFPIVSKEQYRQYEANKLIHNYFDNSLAELVSFFVKDKNVSLADAEEIMKLIQPKQ